VPANDNAWDQHANLISAAHAAASWARARRAQWANAPATRVGPIDTGPVTEFDFVPEPASIPPPVEHVPAPAAYTLPPVFPPAEVSADPAASVASRTIPLASPLVPWLIRGGIAVAVLAGAVLGGRYLWNSLPSFSSKTAANRVEPQTGKADPKAAKPDAKPEKADPKSAKAAAAKAGPGTLQVTTSPPGAQVMVDGKARGVTPLTLTDLNAGRHDVVVKGDGGSVQRTITIATNQTASIDEAIFSGFVTVYAPFDVTITEGGRVLRADDRHQVMLPSGPHELRFSNRALAYDVTRKVDIKPGEATNLQLTPEPSSITVTATSPAEVWLDGTRLGDTPLNNASVSIGEHDIVVRRQTGGERRFTITVGAKPYTLNVEF
jgi:PEGA domain-containing protein